MDTSPPSRSFRFQWLNIYKIIWKLTWTLKTQQILTASSHLKNRPGSIEENEVFNQSSEAFAASLQGNYSECFQNGWTFSGPKNNGPISMTSMLWGIGGRLLPNNTRINMQPNKHGNFSSRSKLWVFDVLTHPSFKASSLRIRSFHPQRKKHPPVKGVGRGPGGLMLGFPLDVSTWTIPQPWKFSSPERIGQPCCEPKKPIDAKQFFSWRVKMWPGKQDNNTGGMSVYQYTLSIYCNKFQFLSFKHSQPM